MPNPASSSPAALPVVHKPWESPLVLPDMSNTTDRHERFRVTSRYMEVEGKPAIPLSGELHYSRVDAAAFVRACAEVGLDVVLRIGPWWHGEVHNGGFPDRVQQAPVQHRTKDPSYPDLVKRWFGYLGEELAGLLGPNSNVIGIQLENELYDQGGENKGKAYDGGTSRRRTPSVKRLRARRGCCRSVRRPP
ncbi:beta-galactosidase [Arthrobacter sp. MPF02]|uniref:beta-galactosidase n=1 Tax=Arthrobacter sp. MPF02 TaxID=3388492 RepID=UPI00398564FF